MTKTILLRGFLLSGVALAISACGNLSNVSDEGSNGPAPLYQTPQYNGQ